MGGMGGMGDPYGMGDYGGGEPNPPPFDDITSLETLEDFIHHTADDTEIGGGVLGIFEIPEFPDEENAEQMEGIQESAAYQAAEAYFEAARNMHERGYRFGFSTTPELVEHFKVKGWKIFVYLPPFYVAKEHGEKPRKRFPGATSLQSRSLETFIEANSIPLVGRITPDNENIFRFSEKPVFTLFSEVSKDENTKLLAEKLRKIAIKYKDEALFALVDKNQAMVLKAFKLWDVEEEKVEDKDFQAMFCRDSQAKKAWKAKSSLFQDFEAFVEAVMKGSLDDEIIEEVELPGSDTDDYYEDTGEEKFDDGVESVDENSLQELLDSSNKHVLVEFYAPWCGHCQQFAPEYAKIAEQLNGESVVVVKMNGDENVVPPQFTVEGFPTLYFVPKDRKLKPVSYEGKLSRAAIIDFVKNHDHNHIGENIKEL
mmetsp:Transcript_20237/g.24535  ORF Transcript_20237/g.24535 Transcript_20237/m.24535 type:complete len:426 (+) Transcript_20237:1-1278(+)